MAEHERIKITQERDGSFPPLKIALNHRYEVTVVRSPRFVVTLHDAKRKVMANAPYKVLFGDDVLKEGVSDPAGRFELELPKQCPERLELRWGQDADHLDNYLDLMPACSLGSGDNQLIARLNNLGYPSPSNLQAAVRNFQLDFEVDHEPEPKGLIAGALPEASQRKLEAIYASGQIDGDQFTTQQAAATRQDNSPAVAGGPLPVLLKYHRVRGPNNVIFTLPICVSCFEVLITAGISPRAHYAGLRSGKVSFFGRKTGDTALHQELIDALSAAESALLPNPRPSAEDVGLRGTELGLSPNFEPISAFRPQPKQASLSLHLFGMAVDIDPVSQFHISAEVLATEAPGNLGPPRAGINEILKQAELLVERGGSSPDWSWPTQRLPDSKKVLAIDANLVRYFSLILPGNESDLVDALRDPARLPSEVWDKVVSDAEASVLAQSPAPPDPTAVVNELMLDAARQIINADMEKLLARADKAPEKWDELKQTMATRGVVGMTEELVKVLERFVVWMGEDGDLMHVDTRSDPQNRQNATIGSRINSAIRSFKGDAGRLQRLENTWADGLRSLIPPGGNAPDIRKTVTGKAATDMVDLFAATYR